MNLTPVEALQREIGYARDALKLVGQWAPEQAGEALRTQRVLLASLELAKAVAEMPRRDCFDHNVNQKMCDLMEVLQR